MGLDECSYARYMGAVNALMESLPPGWQPTARSPIEPDSRAGDPARPSIPSRRPTNTAVEHLV